jgi:hypothetical protein
MIRKFVMLAVSVSLLGFTVGCGGPGEATTIKAEERPADLRQKGGDKPADEEHPGVPEGVTPN